MNYSCGNEPRVGDEIERIDAQGGGDTVVGRKYKVVSLDNFGDPVTDPDVRSGLGSFARRFRLIHRANELPPIPWLDGSGVFHVGDCDAKAAVRRWRSEECKSHHYELRGVSIVTVYGSHERDTGITLSDWLSLIVGTPWKEEPVASIAPAANPANPPEAVEIDPYPHVYERPLSDVPGDVMRLTFMHGDERATSFRVSGRRVIKSQTSWKEDELKLTGYVRVHAPVDHFVDVNKMVPPEPTPGMKEAAIELSCSYVGPSKAAAIIARHVGPELAAKDAEIAELRTTCYRIRNVFDPFGKHGNTTLEGLALDNLEAMARAENDRDKMQSEITRQAAEIERLTNPHLKEAYQNARNVLDPCNRDSNMTLAELAMDAVLSMAIAEKERDDALAKLGEAEKELERLKGELAAIEKHVGQYGHTTVQAVVACKNRRDEVTYQLHEMTKRAIAAESALADLRSRVEKSLELLTGGE